MKILLINDYGIEIGGVETYLNNYKTYLKNQGHEVKVLTSKSPDSYKTISDYTFKGLNVNSLARVFPYIFNYESYKTLKKILKDYKPDIVHLHFIFYHTSPSILFLLKDFKTVMTLHAQEIIAPVGTNFSEKCKHPFIGYCIKCSGILRYYPEIFKRYYFKKLSKRINYFIAPSKYYADLHAAAGFGPITYIYNGIQKGLTYKPMNHKSYNILYVGRLAIEKGTEYSIRALPFIVKKFPKTTLTIVGDGPDASRLQQLAKELKIQKHIKMIGKVPNDETLQYYEKANVVVVPSTYPDNLPTVCIEAMHAGRPVIGSNNGGIPELIDDGVTGYLIEPANASIMAEKILQLFSNNKLLIAMSKNAKAKSEYFTINRNTQNVLKLYKHIQTSKVVKSIPKSSKGVIK